jgi:hypothetical protein
MPIEIITDNDALVMLGPKKTFGRWNRPEIVVDYLFEALEIIRQRLRDDKRTMYEKLKTKFVIDISRSYIVGRLYDYPYFEEPLAAWKTLAKHRFLHDRLKDWVVKLEALVAEATPKRNENAVYESGESQLGEVGLRALALTDKSFVPFYVRMLKVWNSVHAERGIFIDDVIGEIVGKYGLCPETEQLIECAYSPAWRYDENELPRLLKNFRKDLPNYPLFRRIVATHNEFFATEYREEYRAIMDRLRKNPNAPIAGRAAERWLFDSFSGIRVDADIVLAELDAANLSKS